MRLALLGDPVTHSLSPAIFAAAFAAAGIDGHYEARQAGREGVEKSFDDVRAGRLDGLNVTMPHKTLAFALCDRVDGDARRAGSVNTVLRQDGELVGYSTDIAAISDCWSVLPGDVPALVLGSGGAAAAAVIAIQGIGVEPIYISTRTFGRGSVLGERLSVDLGEVHWGVPVVLANIVNCTPLGMDGEGLPHPVVELASGLLDMPYRSTPTPAVLAARGKGLPLVEGKELLVAQAAGSFRLWTGQEPPLATMRQAVENS